MSDGSGKGQGNQHNLQDKVTMDKRWHAGY